MLRGDGAFEVMRIHQGEIFFLARHLVRLAHSAARLELTLPDLTRLRNFILETAAAWPSDTEGMLRLVCSRGRAGTDIATVYCAVTELGPETARFRRDGVRLCTGASGFSAEARASAPWLLGGVKSLSYAVHMAGARWAARNGADDLLWTTTAGQILETTGFSIVWIDGRRLCTVPADTGVVAGTTAGALLAKAGELGLAPAERMVTVNDLTKSDGVWATGSLSGVVAVRSIDRRTMPDSPLIGQARSLLGYPAE
ncbi:aminotransferase class IV [Micromonospora sp. NPDC049559]|uniref:aminotransferase class IV n=1 Tax=Micromonospora sp. NPDC049559 TaxID=3155923 RepID=UPI00344A380B